jgi:ATP-dependent RNA helicase DeaD
MKVVNMSLFSDFSLKNELLKAIADLKFTEPTAIQNLAIPPALEGKDILAQAQTGTGKTAAFSLPLLSQLDSRPGIQMLVLTPTRELAQQVSDDIKKYGRYINVKVATIIGGKSYREQRKALDTAQVLVGTPGRLIDLLESGIANFEPRFVVLDEADRMLDMGFQEDLEKIATFMPEEKQVLLFSATFPKYILGLADVWLKKDAVRLKASNENSTNAAIEQFFSVVYNDEKDEALFRILQAHENAKAIIFCEMKRDADRVGSMLHKRGFDAFILHGDTEQRRREAIMQEFRRAKAGILVATDVAARGLDVADITHVINFQIPNSFDSYVHRIGRTGRAGKSGLAYTLITPSEEPQLFRFEKITGAKLKFAPVPSVSTIQKKQVENLKSQIGNLEIHPAFKAAAHNLIEQMEEGTSTGKEEIIARLLQKFLAQDFAAGPDKMGLTEDEFMNLRQRRRTGGSSSRDGGRPRFGGGGRSGGRSFGGRRSEGRGEGRDEGRSDRSPRRFEGGGEDRPARRFEGNSEDRPARRFEGGGEGRPARRSEGGGEGRPARRSEGGGEGRPARRFEGGGEGRPARRSEGGSDRPRGARFAAGSTRKESSEGGGRPRKSLGRGQNFSL